LCRSQIQPLLDRISSDNLECIDGIEAFKLFFPEKVLPAIQKEGEADAS
jgi:hypothetical protein